MDLCSICLEESDEDQTPRIKEKSLQWEKNNVQQIINKHLWWWYKKNNIGDSSWICIDCWKHLCTFHKFYVHVEKQHNQYKDLLKFHSCNKIDVNEVLITSIEQMEREEESITMDHLVPLDILRTSTASALLPDNLESENLTTAPFTDMHVKVVPDEYQYSNKKKNFDKNTISESEECNLKGKLRQTKSLRKASKKSAGTAKIAILSSAQLVKNYDEFISANFEIYCSLCANAVLLANFHSLKIHFQHDHNETKPFVTCCGLKIHKRAILVDHLKTHKNPESFKCHLCSKSLPNRLSLRNHLDWHDKSSKPQIKCSDCPKIFFTKASFDNHKLSHIPENGKHIPCTECNKKFASDSLRLRHFNAAHLKKYAQVCDTCGKQFSNRERFHRHIAEHEGAAMAPIQCDICGMKITTIYGLNRHKKLRHTEESTKEVRCPFCSKLKTNAVALRSHIEYVHQQRKHACNLCGKAFRRPFDLKEHLNTHTGETPYACDHCPKQFKRHNKLYIHIKNQHPQEWEDTRKRRMGGCVLKTEEEILKNSYGN